jgi:hypothetical protein
MAGVGTIAGFSVVAQSADHQDAPGTKASPTADINDVFSWMDGNNVVLAMTTNPGAATGTQFDNTVQYVFHTGNAIAPVTVASGIDVIATFDTSTPQNIQLWVAKGTTTLDYVTGNAGVAAGLASADSKVKVYAGLVADPFFFNLDGFHSAVADVVANEGSLTFNDAGCPTLSANTATALVQQLGLSPTLGAPVNHFATLNGMGIVVSIDKTLLTTSTNALVSVWGATYSTGTAGDAGITDAGGQ